MWIRERRSEPRVPLERPYSGAHATKLLYGVLSRNMLEYRNREDVALASCRILPQSRGFGRTVRERNVEDNGTRYDAMSTGKRPGRI